MKWSSTRRILMVSTHGYVSAKPELGRPDTGGQVVYVLELAKALAKRGHTVEILTRQFENQPAQEHVAHGVFLRRIPCGGLDFIPKEWLCDHIDEWVAGAISYLEFVRQDFDLVISHYWDAGIAGAKLATALSIPHIHVPHSLGASKKRSMANQPIDSSLNFDVRIASERNIYRQSSKIVATSQEQVSDLEDHYRVRPGKVCNLPAGYCEERFFCKSDSRRRANKNKFSMERPTILCLGRIADNKGYDLMIRGMPSVLTRVPSVQLVLAIGSTQLSPLELEQVERLEHLTAELGISDAVSFHSHIPDEDLADYYNAADVFVLSSSYEPFGMTAIEAMACGTPTVITTRGGLWENLRWGVHTLYVDPFDKEALAHCVSMVLTDPHLSTQLSSNAFRYVRERFRWSAIASLFEEQAFDGTTARTPREVQLWSGMMERTTSH